MHRKVRIALILFVVTGLRAFAIDGTWRTYDPGFRSLGITNGANGTLWVCGSDASIAVSNDNGVHWEVRDQNRDHGLFLMIQFQGQFGYAVGTTGYLAFTHDAGATWRHSAVPYRDVLSGSFSDETHGLLQTRSAVLATRDGKGWSPVSEQHADSFKKFPYVMAVAALDDRHMAIHISQAPPSGSGFLLTTDGGLTWKLLGVPDTTITSLLVVRDLYWAVGTEVIQKNQPGGGHAVPLLLFSKDGEKWEHSQHDIQMCHWEGCGGRCTNQGCLAASGLAMSIFDETVNKVVFPPNTELTVKWAITPTTMCFVGAQIECANAQLDSTADATKMEGTAPTADAQPLMKAASTTSGVQCLACGLQSIFVDSKANGRYTLKVALEIDKNGIVRSVEIYDSPSKTLEESMKKSMMAWVFFPHMKDGLPANLKLRTTVNVVAIKPR
jgi:hypothetical protein